MKIIDSPKFARNDSCCKDIELSREEFDRLGSFAEDSEEQHEYLYSIMITNPWCQSRFLKGYTLQTIRTYDTQAASSELGSANLYRLGSTGPIYLTFWIFVKE